MNYSEPDAFGIQRILLSQVVVGDFCQGRKYQKVPDGVNDIASLIVEIERVALKRETLGLVRGVTHYFT